MQLHGLLACDPAADITGFVWLGLSRAPRPMTFGTFCALQQLRVRQQLEQLGDDLARRRVRLERLAAAGRAFDEAAAGIPQIGVDQWEM